MTHDLARLSPMSFHRVSVDAHAASGCQRSCAYGQMVALEAVPKREIPIALVCDGSRDRLSLPGRLPVQEGGHSRAGDSLGSDKHSNSPPFWNGLLLLWSDEPLLINGPFLYESLHYPISNLFH